MGLIGSYVKLAKISKEMEAKSDVPGSLASMQGKLDGLNASMQAQSAQAAASADPASRLRREQATATVTAACPTGAQINGSYVVELQLLVMLASGIPIPVSHTASVPQLDLPKVQSGARLPVSLDPASPASLSIDWTRAA